MLASFILGYFRVWFCRFSPGRGAQKCSAKRATPATEKVMEGLETIRRIPEAIKQQPVHTTFRACGPILLLLPVRRQDTGSHELLRRYLLNTDPDRLQRSADGIMNGLRHSRKQRLFLFVRSSLEKMDFNQWRDVSFLPYRGEYSPKEERKSRNCMQEIIGSYLPPGQHLFFSGWPASAHHELSDMAREKGTAQKVLDKIILNIYLK